MRTGMSLALALYFSLPAVSLALDKDYACKSFLSDPNVKHFLEQSTKSKSLDPDVDALRNAATRSYVNSIRMSCGTFTAEISSYFNGEAERLCLDSCQKTPVHTSNKEFVAAICGIGCHSVGTMLIGYQLGHNHGYGICTGRESKADHETSSGNANP